MRYWWCRLRGHDVNRDVWPLSGLRAYQCPDCGVMWSDLGMFREMDEQDRMILAAERAGVVLPPLWRYTHEKED